MFKYFMFIYFLKTTLLININSTLQIKKPPLKTKGGYNIDL